MKLYTIENIKYEKNLGMVIGSTVKGKFFIKDFISGIRKILGKELTEYSELMNETRKLSIEKMEKDAEKIGANAVIGVRFATSDITRDAAEISVYGTAVLITEQEEKDS